jgi:hypothetical protein
LASKPITARASSSIVLSSVAAGRLEAEEHAPERTDEQSFEAGRGEHRGTGAPGLTERRCKQTARAEANEQREQHARRKERGENAGGCGLRRSGRRLPCGELGGVCVGGVTVRGVAMRDVRAVATVPPMSGVTAVAGVAALAGVTDVGEAAHRHRGEASTAKREAEPIDVHTPNTTSRTGAW